DLVESPQVVVMPVGRENRLHLPAFACFQNAICFSGGVDHDGPARPRARHDIAVVVIGPDAEFHHLDHLSTTSVMRPTVPRERNLLSNRGLADSPECVESY